MASGLQHAHDLGIVHRDIKPSNLLLDSDGNIQITDFGLAQVQGDAGITLTGDMIGTLRYMSPEQAHAKRIVVDHRTDIYSLGVTLYELLTLNKAFDSESRTELLRQIAFEEPRRPRKINRHIPLELETIVSTAMAKNPDERYQSAGLLAEDLERFSKDEPIQARPLSLVQRASKWAKRHKGLVASASIVLAAILVSAVSLSFALYGALQDETQESARYQSLWRKSEGLRAATNSSLQLASNPGLALRLGIIAAELYPGREANDALQQALDANHEYLTLAGDNGAVGSVGLHAGTNRLVVAAAAFRRDPRLPRVWDLSDRSKPKFVELATQDENGDRVNPRVTSAVFSPRGRRILTASSAGIRTATDDLNDKLPSLSPVVWESAGGSYVELGEGAYLFHTHKSCFSPSGRSIVTPAVGNLARVFDAVEGTLLYTLRGHTKRVIYAGFSPDGNSILTISDDESIRVWDAKIPPDRVATSREEFVFSSSIRMPGATIRSASISPDSDWLLVTTKDSKISLRKLGANNSEDPVTWFGRAAKFSPDGQWIAYSHGDHTALNTALGTSTGRVFEGHFEEFSRDGELLATSRENVVLVWEVSTGKAIAECRGHDTFVQNVNFGTDSARLVSADRSGVVRIWNVRSGSELSHFGVQPNRTTKTILAVSRDSRHLLVSRRFSLQTSVCNLKTFGSIRSLDGMVSAPGLAKDRFIIVANNQALVESADLEQTVAQLHSPSGEQLEAALLSPSGKYALVRDVQGAAWLWDVDNDVTNMIATTGGKVSDFTFHPSVDQCATASTDGFVRIWEASTGKPLGKLDHQGERLVHVEYCPSGQTMATVTASSTSRLWRVNTGKLRFQLRVEAGTVRMARFSSDGRHLVTYHPSKGGQVHCWSTQNGELLFSTATTGKTHVAMSPRLDQAAIASDQGVSIWNLADGVARELTLVPTSATAFNQDGRRLLTMRRVQMTPPRQLHKGAIERFRGPAALVWDVASGQPVKQLDFVEGNVIRVVPHIRAGLLSITQLRFGAEVFDLHTHQPLQTIIGHGAPLSFAAVLDNGRLITTSWDQRAAIWRDGVPLKLAGHKSAITAAAVSPDQSLLATCDADGRVAVWSVADGARQQQASIKHHTDRVTFCCFDETSERLLTASLDGIVHIFSLNSQATSITRHPEGYIGSAAFSPQGPGFILVVRRNPAAARTQDDEKPSVKLYASIDQRPKLLHSDPAAIWAGYAENGQAIVTGNALSADIWNATSGKHIRPLDYRDRTAQSFSVHTKAGLLLTQFEDSIALWNTADGAELMNLTTELSSVLGEHAVLSPDGGQIVASISRRVRSYAVDVLQYARRLAPRHLSESERLRLQVPLPDDR